MWSLIRLISDNPQVQGRVTHGVIYYVASVLEFIHFIHISASHVKHYVLCVIDSCTAYKELIFWQYLNQEHVIQKLADSKVIRSAARFFVSTIYGMRISIFRDFSERIKFFSKTFGEELKKSLTQKK